MKKKKGTQENETSRRLGQIQASIYMETNICCCLINLLDNCTHVWTILCIASDTICSEIVARASAIHDIVGVVHVP